jgi:hypothetical protein
VVEMEAFLELVRDLASDLADFGHRPRFSQRCEGRAPGPLGARGASSYIGSGRTFHLQGKKGDTW